MMFLVLVCSGFSLATSHCYKSLGKTIANAVAVLMMDKVLWEKLFHVYSYLR